MRTNKKTARDGLAHTDTTLSSSTGCTQLTTTTKNKKLLSVFYSINSVRHSYVSLHLSSSPTSSRRRQQQQQKQVHARTDKKVIIRTDKLHGPGETFFFPKKKVEMVNFQEQEIKRSSSSTLDASARASTRTTNWRQQAESTTIGGYSAGGGDRQTARRSADTLQCPSFCP